MNLRTKIVCQIIKPLKLDRELEKLYLASSYSKLCNPIHFWFANNVSEFRFNCTDEMNHKLWEYEL